MKAKRKEKAIESEISFVNLDNLDKHLKKIKSSLSSGEDGISNILLKHVPTSFKKVLVHLFKSSIKYGQVPERWKKVIVKMIPKKDNNKQDPKNYRPISLTSTIARLCERFILEEILDHIKTNKIIIKQQSGFRSYRQTKDNILTICQRNIESFNQKKKNCVIFFDIKKAFDKVWHNGLLYKLKKYNFKEIIIRWIAEFLNGRSFQVKVNTNLSIAYQIETGVPQGGVLSPVLFTIFINDILINNNKNKKFNVESNLFADDLASSCSSSSLKIIERELNKHLQNLENWLKLWRLNMSSSKCQYIIFSKDPKAIGFELKLKLFNGLIPKTDCIKFLGIKLNHNMNLNECISELKNKCNKRLNILKI